MGISFANISGTVAAIGLPAGTHISRSFAVISVGHWSRRHWLRTFGSEEISDSDESLWFVELYVEDWTFRVQCGWAKEYNPKFEEVLSLSTGHRPSVLQLTDHNVLVTALEWLKTNAPFRRLTGPYRCPSGGDLTEAQRQHNSAVAWRRVVAENAFAATKLIF